MHKDGENLSSNIATLPRPSKRAAGPSPKENFRARSACQARNQEAGAGPPAADQTQADDPEDQPAVEAEHENASVASEETAVEDQAPAEPTRLPRPMKQRQLTSRPQNNLSRRWKPKRRRRHGRSSRLRRCGLMGAGSTGRR